MRLWIFWTICTTFQTSMADLLAMGLSVSFRSCGGLHITVQAGCIDTTSASPEGVPEPTDDLSSIAVKFMTVGFNTTKMIQMVACGHCESSNILSRPSVSWQSIQLQVMYTVLTFPTSLEIIAPLILFTLTVSLALLTLPLSPTISIALLRIP